ncbi:hypothetical protein SAY86_023807 [Trapa natans]|uniref:Uncharacterized protein n=1 Tax=Trapa natans TaxID=22666 RepID=A0AAN7M7Z2_TRANT|nr:hypothetical protein SAY86_023807 [Trapa natans]
MGNGRAAAGGPRKSKKSSSGKSKQPQRGLGVAQLEKIRLYGQMGGSGCSSYGQFHEQYHPIQHPSSSVSQEELLGQTAYSSVPSSSYEGKQLISYTSPSASRSFNPNIMMRGIGSGDYERGSIRYGDYSQHSTHMSWNSSHGFMAEMPQCMQPSAMAGQPLNFHVQNPHDEDHKKYHSSLHGSEMNDTQELDLELRLSL